MNRPDIDLRDIYQAKSSPPEEDSSQTIQEIIGRELRRQQIFNFSGGVLVLILLGTLAVSVIREYLPKEPFETPVIFQPSYIAIYTLPADELWALEYRQAAEQQDSSGGPAVEQILSGKWVKNAAYHLIMGTEAARQKDWATAQKHFEIALKLFPHLLGAHHALGAIYLQQQYFEPAVEQLQLALEEDPSIDVLNNLGAAYIGTEQYKQAETMLKKALSIQPNLAGCYKNLTLLYQNSGRTNDAIAAFETYLTLSPQDTNLLKAYTDYLIGAGQLNAAIGFLDRLEGGDRITVQTLLATTAARNNDADRAVRALRELFLHLSPWQIIEIMHKDTFRGIAHTPLFESLMYELELSSVSYSGNLDLKTQPQ
jgi:Tfp pilus assembly protein PilF